MILVLDEPAEFDFFEFGDGFFEEVAEDFGPLSTPRKRSRKLRQRGLVTRRTGGIVSKVFRSVLGGIKSRRSQNAMKITRSMRRWAIMIALSSGLAWSRIRWPMSRLRCPRYHS